jgi:hypothetical protein
MHIAVFWQVCTRFWHPTGSRFWKWDLISPNHWQDLDVTQGSSSQALMLILGRVLVPMPSGKDSFSRKNAPARDISLFIPLILRHN